MSKIYDAVTSVLVHDGEVFMTRRQPQLPAFSGFTVFPGGKVDATDLEGSDAPELLCAHPPPMMRALARELQEEVGWDLLQACAHGDVERVDLLGITLTPPTHVLRFNTYLYRIILRRRPEFVLDAREVAEGEWATPAALLQRYESGDLLCAWPTLQTLKALAEDLNVPSIERLALPRGASTEMPVLELLHGVRQFWVRSHTLPPAEHTNCYVLGDMQSHRVMVDPSPCSDEEMEKVIAVAQRFTVHEIFLTHHHPDHCERADEIARRLQIPVGMSEDTRNRIYDRSEGRFFRDIPGTNVYQDGDVLCRWLGHPVRVLAVPGHDEGQLALMPDNRAWCLVGDLIQGIGTVVIAKPEGNMRKYFESLRRIIELDPKVIFPSHGNALGTTYRLRETLKHRELRERQILELCVQGQSVDDILPQIYVGLDPRLLPLARLNIESHLDKLREDGRLAA